MTIDDDDDFSIPGPPLLSALSKSHKGRPNKHHHPLCRFLLPVQYARLARCWFLLFQARAHVGARQRAAEDDYSGTGERRRRRDDSVVLFLETRSNRKNVRLQNTKRPLHFFKTKSFCVCGIVWSPFSLNPMYLFIVIH